MYLLNHFIKFIAREECSNIVIVYAGKVEKKFQDSQLIEELV